MTVKEFKCRSCGGIGLTKILDLGETPLANALLTKEQISQPEDVFPLNLYFCPHCKLLQISETVAPERLFRDYFYFSSFSTTAIENARSIAFRMVTERKLDKSNLVIELASNDGYLLKHYQEKNVSVLGIEPAKNVARIANDQGIPTIPEFFTSDFAANLHQQYPNGADVMHANNVLAHVADLNGFVDGIATMLNATGVAIIECPYGKTMVENVEFDTIYHEHLCYFTVTTLQKLFGRHDLTLQDVELLPIHGGSLRLFVGHERKISESVRFFLANEEKWGVNTAETYLEVAKKVETLKRDLVSLLKDLKRQKKRIVAYGASAKGATLLNYLKINGNYLDYVVDRSTIKQGFYTPGTHLEIFPPEKLLDDKPDYALLLTWNFWEEIVAQQDGYLKDGGKFIIPIPEIRII
ncbi:MAG: class I SAM-dependent methyltransferase [Fibrobacter sp.]|nr:class I SAM-dependent methyltransferase [Fibrobacter sp.]